jgi:hypothetical protein
MILQNVHVGKGWGSHIPMLMKAIQLTDKKIVEIGAGIISTNFLHWYCRERDQKMVTYEEDDQYYHFAKSFVSLLHKVVKVENWEDISNKQDWGVLLIDNYTGQRVKDLIKFKDSADYIVVHDTDKPEQYGFTDDVWGLFKYRYDWRECHPWTTVVSNKKDLKEFTNNK